MRPLRIAGIGILALGLLAAASSQASADGRCIEARGEIVDQPTADNCPPDFTCIAGVVRLNHGIHGTSFFLLDSVAPGPSTAPGYRSVNGRIVFTLDDGDTITASETAISNQNLNAGTGHAGGVEDITGGTGRYAGASGFMYVDQHPDDHHFIAQIHGQICRAT